MRSSLVLALLLGGCLGWQEAPEGATGFLIVDDERLEGVVDGVAIDSGTTRASGYCTERGWTLRMEARAGAEDVITVIHVQDLAMRDRDVDVQFVPGAASTEQELFVVGPESGRATLRTCLGSETDPTYEAFATDVFLTSTPTGRTGEGDIDVSYGARFANGDQIQGDFTMEMPVTD